MRKRGKGRRDRSGKLLRPKTRAERETNQSANDNVLKRAARFSPFRTDKAKPLRAEEHYDGPGQAHLAGLFDGYDVDPITLRDAAREYGELYWGWYVALGAKSANIGRNPSGRSRGDEATARERRFQRLDDVLGMTGSPVRRAVCSISVDYWGRDEIAPFLERLINEQRIKRGFPVAGRLPDESDHKLMETALEGLLAMVAGRGTDCNDNRSAA
jgi:hypothetical protein